jgi:hypothetical protein
MAKGQWTAGGHQPTSVVSPGSDRERCPGCQAAIAVILIVPAVEASMRLLDMVQWWCGQPCVPNRRVERHLTCTASYRAVYTHPRLAFLLGVEDILAHVQYSFLFNGRVFFIRSGTRIRYPFAVVASCG